MPQLSPLNWMFLFFLHWALIFSLSISFWWMKKDFYAFKYNKIFKSSKLQNKWSW